MTRPYVPSDDEKREALKVCRHGDPRCTTDPCPKAVWELLCKPEQGAHHADH
ncbi:hypothetical protein UFOVP406_29 [uncultured Caudovirales phage]|uniref:Uncharacterized protein n=1 Tax=uncultured Caudovirales phage TaxID=2100421 RepID=A0A6J5M5X5_9CAUD|nr:hypothetical protein UFOVP406_29 [uncultured Caudovirales phage]